MPSYMMSGALPVPQIHDYYSHEHIHEKSSLKSKCSGLFDRYSDKYNALIKFKNHNIELIASNDDLALSYALVASCYTYVQDKNYNISSLEKTNLTDRFRGHRNKFNGFFSITKFKI